MMSALTTFPDEFKCGIADAGISDLGLFLSSVPPYWSRWRLNDYVGQAKKDAAFLRERSPLFKADRVKAPLMIIHGENDPRCTKAQADQMVAALRENKRDVQYLVIPEWGHSAAPWINYRIEKFLGTHLHGYVESPNGNELRADNSR